MMLGLQIYEQINPGTMFGRQMIRNLEERGAPLYGVKSTPTLAAHVERLHRCGWPRAQADDLNTIYREVIEPNDRMRVEALEMFDEFEEWHLIMGHYCVAMGVKDDTRGLDGLGFQKHGVKVAAARGLEGGVRSVGLPNAD
jgi:tRNA wybutosine-synthesizing protein 4